MHLTNNHQQMTSDTMKKTIYISIFGLNLSLINELKNIISKALNSEYIILWTNIADEKLQLLLVNDNFSDSPNIQKLALKKIKIIKLQKDETNTSIIQNNILYHPINDEKPLSIWVKKFFQDLEKSAQTDNLDPIDTTNISLKRKFSFTQLNPIFNLIYQDTQTGKHTIKTSNQIIALVDFDNYHFYIAPELTILDTNYIEIIKASLDDILSFKKTTRALDLKQGTWQFIWDYLDQDIPEYHDYYRLERWPKFLNLIDRQNILKLSTVFSLGSNNEHTAKKLKIGIKYINFFLCICDLNHDLKKISIENAKFICSDSPQLENNGVRGFFKSLRKKLGL